MSHASCHLCIRRCDLERPHSVLWGGRGLFKLVRGLRSRGFVSKRERNPEVADYNLHSQRVWCHVKGDDPFQSYSSASSFNIFLSHVGVFAEKFITTDNQSALLERSDWGFPHSRFSLIACLTRLRLFPTTSLVLVSVCCFILSCADAELNSPAITPWRVPDMTEKMCRSTQSDRLTVKIRCYQEPGRRRLTAYYSVLFVDKDCVLENDGGRLACLWSPNPVVIVQLPFNRSSLLCAVRHWNVLKKIKFAIRYWTGKNLGLQILSWRCHLNMTNISSICFSTLLSLAGVHTVIHFPVSIMGFSHFFSAHKKGSQFLLMFWVEEDQ